MPRAVSVVDCGRVVGGPHAARCWAASSGGAALREESEAEECFGGFLNANLAEYLIPVNADVGAVEVEFIVEPDPLLSSVGIKGLGEVAMTGVTPAISNAVLHATGRRLRDLSLRIEHLL